ncbi:glycoside hydrolase family 5 protein [uncultured Treponema sp.]|uniref:glycoside hydrolase family 5 protein n=1 Tax=uncultured Treponema sp. TaxID=162155 RepID=UPI0025F564A6|nr:glycoside hydrolase family 5 protein [uncultured Treponema sp.]
MKKCLAVLFFSIYLSCAFAGEKYLFSAKKAVKDKKSVQFNECTAQELADRMKCGWNLGNTLDANGCAGLDSELSWGQPHTTKEMIDAIAAAGFKTIRIPCSWANHFVDSNYTIDSAWMKRVKQIVDWAIEDGLYVILNDHHDNYERENLIPHCKGYYPSSLNYNESMLFVKNVWAQIALAFNKGYDEHLIFEVLNEPRLRGHSHEWWYNQGCTVCKDGATNLNKLNQLAVNTIRASGKNNANRFIMVTGLAASINSYQADESWKLPNDSAEGKLMVSVHLYTPYTFAMENPGATVFEEKHAAELEYNFTWLNEHFVSKGIPVIIGEYGATNKNNLDERVKWFSYFVGESHKYGMVTCLWDNGDPKADNTFEEKFGFFNRKNLNWYFPEIIDTIVEKSEAK